MGVKWNILDCFKVLLYYRIIVFFRVIVLKYVVWQMVVSGASHKPAENSQAVTPGVASTYCVIVFLCYSMWYCICVIVFL